MYLKHQSIGNYNSATKVRIYFKIFLKAESTSTEHTHTHTQSPFAYVTKKKYAAVKAHTFHFSPLSQNLYFVSFDAYSSDGEVVTVWTAQN